MSRNKTLFRNRIRFLFLFSVICPSCTNTLPSTSYDDSSFTKYDKDTPVEFTFRSFDNGCCHVETSQFSYPYTDQPYDTIETLVFPSFSPDNERVISASIPLSFQNLKKIQLPKSIINITQEAFCSLPKLSNINIPDNVMRIGKAAFKNDVSLPSIQLEKVKIIDEEAFGNCGNLESLDLGSSLLEIKDYAFADCTVLRSLSFPNTLKSIGFEAFSYNLSLTSLTIPGSVETIWNEAFLHCDRLESLTIEDGVRYIGSSAFESSALRKVFIPKSVTHLDMNAFDNPKETLTVYCEANVKPEGFIGNSKEKVTYVFGTTKDEFSQL